MSFLVGIENFTFKLSRKPAKLSGSREEHILFSQKTPASQNLINIANEIKSKSVDLQDKEMVYASIIIAKKNALAQFEAHTDSQTPNVEFVRSLTYLTDVPDETHGPIQFDRPVLGPKGTTVTYASNVLHSGMANTSDYDRVALTIIFKDRGLLRLGEKIGDCTVEQCTDYCDDNDISGWCLWDGCLCTQVSTENNAAFWIFIVLVAVLLLVVFSKHFMKKQTKKK